MSKLFDWLWALLVAAILAWSVVGFFVWAFTDKPVAHDPYGLQDVPECYDMRGQC